MDQSGLVEEDIPIYSVGVIKEEPVDDGYLEEQYNTTPGSSQQGQAAASVERAEIYTEIAVKDEREGTVFYDVKIHPESNDTVANHEEKSLEEDKGDEAGPPLAQVQNGVPGEGSERRYQCSYCEKSFKKSYTLRNHEMTHTGERPFQCEVCEKRFSRKINLERHGLVHSDERPHTCDICNLSFKQNAHLLRHKVSHSEERPHDCEICQKKFKSYSHLARHKKTHSDETPYQCQHCEKAFNSGTKLNIHLRVHTGEKPFVCQFCQKSFRHRGSWSGHVRLHTGERPYRCDVCGKTFTRGCYLKMHKRIHTGTRPFPCHLCDKAFTQMTVLKTHLKLHETKAKRYALAQMLYAASVQSNMSGTSSDISIAETDRYGGRMPMTLPYIEEHARMLHAASVQSDRCETTSEVRIADSNLYNSHLAVTSPYEEERAKMLRAASIQSGTCETTSEARIGEPDRCDNDHVAVASPYKTEKSKVLHATSTNRNSENTSEVSSAGSDPYQSKLWRLMCGGASTVKNSNAKQKAKGLYATSSKSQISEMASEIEDESDQDNMCEMNCSDEMTVTKPYKEEQAEIPVSDQSSMCYPTSDIIVTADDTEQYEEDICVRVGSDATTMKKTDEEEESTEKGTSLCTGTNTSDPSRVCETVSNIRSSQSAPDQDNECKTVNSSAGIVETPYKELPTRLPHMQDEGQNGIDSASLE